MFTETELTAAQMQDLASQRPVANFQSRFGDDEPRKGADILVEALEREGVDCVFAYPGGASMEIHQSLTKSKTGVRNILCRHEQGEVFAAEGYAKCTRQGGACASPPPAPARRTSSPASRTPCSTPCPWSPSPGRCPGA